ncbi:hypothetical protein C8Q79DRAFT_1004686 [Trametes meyenii]|nr:hypothetical protein C8Q79DRAFT_1004686 [Trametes meyenii]
MSTETEQKAGELPRGLPIDAVARATREAQRDGVFAGLSSGLVSGASSAPAQPSPTTAPVQLTPFRNTPCSASSSIISSFVLTRVLHPFHLAILGSKLFRLNRNATVLCGVGELRYRTSPLSVPAALPAPPLLTFSTTTCSRQLLTALFLFFLVPTVTGVISGYQFTQGFLAANMARLEKEKARLDALAAEHDTTNSF